MPELPEVETVRRDLADVLPGRVIERVDVSDPRLVQGFRPDGAPRRGVSPEEIAAFLAGQTVAGVLRRGKYLIFPLASGRAFLAHLRMTGRLTWGPPEPRARARIFFRGGEEALSFSDARRFGELWTAEDWRQDPSLKALGPDPLDGGLDPEALFRSLRASSARLQSLLLDQRRLAGLGNIYAMEALFRGGLRPHRRGNTLRRAELPGLIKGIRGALESGLRRRGVSFRDYRDAHGRPGRAADALFVYGRAGQPCRRCRAAVKGIKIGGRGTMYCPGCQR